MSGVDLDRAWLEQVAGGTITRLEPMAGGGSRLMYRLDVTRPDGTAHLVVRQEAGAGPYAGTELGSLAREADAYRAVAGRGIPAPELVAVDGRGRTLVATRLPGSNGFHDIADPDEKAAVRHDFLATLARLHRIDASTLDLGDLAIADDARDPARAWVSVWRRLFEAHVRRPVPLLRFAVGWLERHAPVRVRPPVVCHGDVGPGNFLHADGRVTGLLDWELCHLGEPEDDLGMLALRGHQLNAFGDLSEDLRDYRNVSGIDIDATRIRYYRAVALVLGLTTSAMQLDRVADARIQIPLYLHLVPTLRLLLATALAELLGVDAGDPPASDDDADASALEAVTALRDELAAHPATGEPVLGAGPLDLVAHLEAVIRFGKALDAADTEEVARLLGRRPRTYDEGVAALDEAVVARAVDPEALVRAELRSARRRTVLWPSWAPAMTTRLLPIDL